MLNDLSNALNLINSKLRENKMEDIFFKFIHMMGGEVKTPPSPYHSLLP